MNFSMRRGLSIHLEPWSFRQVAFAVGVAALLAGCGKKDDDEDATPGTGGTGGVTATGGQRTGGSTSTGGSTTTGGRTTGGSATGGTGEGGEGGDDVGEGGAPPEAGAGPTLRGIGDRARCPRFGLDPFPGGREFGGQCGIEPGRLFLLVGFTVVAAGMKR